MTKEYVTREELKNHIDTIAKQMNENLVLAIKSIGGNIRELREEFNQAQSENTEKILIAIKSFENQAEKNERTLNNLKTHSIKDN